MVVKNDGKKKFLPGFGSPDIFDIFIMAVFLFWKQVYLAMMVEERERLEAHLQPEFLYLINHVTLEKGLICLVIIYILNLTWYCMESVIFVKDKKDNGLKPFLTF